ncbi:MAG: symmetrical bis(5'-nucleosyl)-tetraphosphatase [gamma proteobacterium symbiont of Bathyaustriella thionipta]|nr:symmetrical bis(5'-nucleosyl)-tetraphosphatase [gamma proteobacterium symbiont of Bathyaustriella thionipta]
MSIYAIGDIQGCHEPLQRLLDKINPDPAKDQLWFCGDLVNRGPQSLQSIRLVKSLGDCAISILGNHDLHLLAVSQGNRSHYHNKSMDDILEASDCDELIDWLRHRKLMHYDKGLKTALVHAGLPPQWTIEQALGYAAELEAVLQSEAFSDYCAHMYGNRPDLWDNNLSGWDRYRFMTNCFTRLRFCDNFGRLYLKYKLAPGTQPAHAHPWFQIKHRRSRDTRILFGHWSTLGYQQSAKTICLDSGCLWGGPLTAVKLERNSAQILQVPCKQQLKPGV